MAAEPAAGGARTLERPSRLSRIEIVANESSGSVGEGAAAEAQAIAEGLGYEVNARAITPHDLIACLKDAIASKPDLLVVIAGDGTANAAAELCGPDGPLVAPLPGGTMNMLPHALYGRTDWKSALQAILSDGRVRPVAGGEVEGHAFTVAAILGDPALWAPAREALRNGNIGKAIAYARYALRRTFTRKLRFSLDGAPHQKAEALALMCPLVSKGVPDDTPALEAVGIDPKSFGGVLRLGLHALLSPLMGPALGGDWRSDPAVTPGKCREGHAYSRRHINAILDGEPIRLPKFVTIRFKPVAFRALVPAVDPHHPPILTDESVGL
jgi:diacylglycerol kinase family enzyme